MNPYLSWVFVLVVAGSLGWYYTNVPHPKSKTAVKPLIGKVESVQDTKKPKRKTKKASPTPPAPAPKSKENPSVKATVPVDEKPEADVDNKEFARQLAAARQGVAPASKGKASGKEKRGKETAVSHLESGSSEVSGSRSSTRASSTTGADADDDLSSAGSPAVKPTVPTAGHVSDMLEAPAPGASVLRLTGSFESAPKKQKQQAFKPVETKKQRQQRLKNEERKRQTQEAEQQRRKLLEQQLHTAREAERREAARFKQPAPANAWNTNNTSSNAVNGASKAASFQDAGLLDTFDDKTSQAPPPVSNNSKPANDSSEGKWTQELPSEEEQMRILGVSGDDAWTTVSGKKGKKKAEKADEGISDISDATGIVSENRAPENQAPSDWVEPKLPQIEKTYLPESFRTGKKNHPLDSDWAA